MPAVLSIIPALTTDEVNPQAAVLAVNVRVSGQQSVAPASLLNVAAFSK